VLLTNITTAASILSQRVVVPANSLHWEFRFIADPNDGAGSPPDGSCDLADSNTKIILDWIQLTGPLPIKGISFLPLVRSDQAHRVEWDRRLVRGLDRGGGIKKGFRLVQLRNGGFEELDEKGNVIAWIDGGGATVITTDSAAGKNCLEFDVQ
jgi:hypothetical protein